MKKMFKVLLYYKYVEIENPTNLMRSQKRLCDKLGLKGRILISQEGINGTVAGREEDIDEYINTIVADKRFSDIEWKVSFADMQIFPKMKVKVRDEIVTLGLSEDDSKNSLDEKAAYIEPEELLELYEKGEDFLILDARNIYEAKVGKFKNAIVPPIDNFRDFPKFLEKISEYRDKTIVTYCTGGVRCEKASGYMRKKGFTDVRQLHGGIHRYSEKTGGKYFEGEMFVFDGRLHTKVNKVNPSVISKCVHCDEKVTRYIDCTAFGCPELFICCTTCDEKYSGTCSDTCKKKINPNRHVTDVLRDTFLSEYK